MSLMDRVKQMAGQMGEAAKKGASQVQSKAEQMQLRRKADEAAKRLGYLVHRERTGGEAAGAEADRLVDEISGAKSQISSAGDAPTAATETRQATDTPPAAESAAATGGTSSASDPATATGATPSDSSSVASGDGPDVPPPAPGQATEEATGE